MKKILGLIILVLSLSQTTANAQKISDFERFQLWSNCEPMRFRFRLDNTSKRHNLIEAEIDEVVRNKLKRAGIYDGNGYPSFLMRVETINYSFLISTKFNKGVVDYKTNLSFVAPVWARAFLGTFKDSDFILSQIKKHTDDFIKDYLRVNADACRKKTR